ncbi:MAG: hypothetical protein RLZZ251_229 [Actinomycetota bacterium]|jgi:uncharacterized protein with FMN-binding domain
MIRKTAFLITGTVTGLVAVLSYNPPKLDNAIAASGSTSLPQSTPESSPSQASSSPTTPTTSVATEKTSKTTPVPNNLSTTQSPTSSSAPTAAPQQSASSSGTFQGETVQTRWGPVQVQITVSNGKITDVSTLQYPNGDRRSMMISSQVIPWLQQEALRVQSANISGIGGATYTSGGFRGSLASAIQKAGL